MCPVCAEFLTLAVNKTSMIRLSSISTSPPGNVDKDACKDATKEYIRNLEELQRLLYAGSKHSLLIVLQGMDAAGKDGVVREVFSAINPMGVNVKSFKKPTDREMAQDFLWRVHRHAPQKGMIQIFNRSHYEDVLIQRVHQWVDMDTVTRRYAHINAFEKLLQDNGTHIIKFFLHVSQEEQHERLKERVELRRKMWKHNPNDLNQSARWDEYMSAYEDAITQCSPDIPWTIVPSDKNWYKEYVVAKTIHDVLKGLDMQYPGLEE
jgi:PPK2 family polyphosphate:nucleotide phosphotransferase